MKVSISNIAWPVEQDDAVAALLGRMMVDGIEVAPTKLWERPSEVSLQQVEAARRAWADRGISIVAMQSLLYGQPELRIFEEPERRERCARYLEHIIEIGGGLGAEALVFGSPKNRQRKGRSMEEAWAIAVDFFGALGRKATSCGTHLVLEANPEEYAADFITSAQDAVRMVVEVAEDGFQLHLDAACMHFAGDDPASIVAQRSPVHVHVTEPWLGPVGVPLAEGGQDRQTPNPVDHVALATALRDCGYSGRLSVEMRPQEPFSLLGLEQSLRFVQTTYLAAGGAS